MDVFHKIFLVARKDTLHSAPLHNQETPRILDLGCGTGIWGIVMAE
jgi:16S rRNA G1207 methylase RsmC